MAPRAPGVSAAGDVVHAGVDVRSFDDARVRGVASGCVRRREDAEVRYQTNLRQAPRDAPRVGGVREDSLPVNRPVAKLATKDGQSLQEVPLCTFARQIGSLAACPLQLVGLPPMRSALAGATIQATEEYAFCTKDELIDTSRRRIGYTRCRV